MNRKVLLNYIYTVIYQILLILLPIITTPYISRVLGVENIGKEAYAGTVVSYFVLFELMGLNLYGMREVAYVQQDEKKRSFIFYQLSFIRVCLFFVVAIVYGIFVILNHGIDKKLFWISGMALWTNLIDITWFFQGMEKFKLITIRNLLIHLLSVFAIFLGVKSRDDLYLYVAISTVGNLVAQLCLWPSLKSIIVRVKFTVRGLKKHFIKVWVMFIPTIFNTLYTKLDKIMLGTLATETEVGLYSQSERINNLLFGVIGAMSIVFMPNLANMLSSGNDKNAVGNTLKMNGKLIWAIGIPLTAGIMGISKVFTNVFFGAGYEKVEYLLYILGPVVLACGISNLYGGQYLIASDHQKEFNLSIAAGAILNICMNYFMIRQWQSIGAAVATLITEVFIAFIQAHMTKKYIQFSIKPDWYYIFAGVLIFGVTKYMDIVLEENVIILVSQIIIGMIMYFFILYINNDIIFVKCIQEVKRRWRKNTCGK